VNYGGDSHLVQLSAFRRQSLQQSRGLAAVALQPLDDLRQALDVGPEHRTAAIGGPAVAVEPDEVDVGGPRGDPFLQNLRALVDQRIEAALQYFGVAYPTLRRALPGREVADDLLDDGGVDGLSILVVVIIARPRLLPPPAVLAQDLADG